MALFDAYSEQLRQCDHQLEQMLRKLKRHEVKAADKKRRPSNKNAPQFDLRSYLVGMCGVDLTRIDGIEVTTALKVMSEVGTDLSRFPSVKHFTSWLGFLWGWGSEMNPGYQTTRGWPKYPAEYKRYST